MIDKPAIAYMNNLREQGYTYKEIAELVPTSITTVHRYLNQPGVHWVKFTTAQIVYIQGLVMADNKTEFPRVRNEVLKVFKLA